MRELGGRERDGKIPGEVGEVVRRRYSDMYY
jgi:hypothetical protein